MSIAGAYTSDEDDKEITEKKVKNKVVINPEMKESKDYDPMEDDEFDHDEAEKNRGVSGKNNPKGGKSLYKKREVKKEEVEQIDEMPYQVMGSTDGKKEKKIGKPVKSKKYADARAAELADTHKKTGGKYRSQYVEGYRSKHRPPAGWKPYGGDEKGPVPEVDATAKRIDAIRKSIKKK
jgi:hypothetical protein